MLPSVQSSLRAETESRLLRADGGFIDGELSASDRESVESHLAIAVKELLR